MNAEVVDLGELPLPQLAGLSDLSFFESNPGRTTRVRCAVAGDLPRYAEGCPVLVRQLQPGEVAILPLLIKGINEEGSLISRTYLTMGECAEWECCFLWALMSDAIADYHETGVGTVPPARVEALLAMHIPPQVIAAMLLEMHLPPQVLAEARLTMRRQAQGGLQ